MPGAFLLMLAKRGESGTPAPSLLTSAIDATGLVLTLNFSRAATAGTGSPTATADGNAISLAYASGTGTATWTYAITSGNPSGNPVLSSADVKLNAAAGVWSGVGATVNGSVTNGSEIGNPGTLSPAAWYSPGPTWCFKDAAKTQPCADGDSIYTWADRSGSGRDLIQATSANRPLLILSGGVWIVRTDGVNDRMQSGFALVNPHTRFFVVKTLSAQNDTHVFADSYTNADLAQENQFNGSNTPSSGSGIYLSGVTVSDGTARNIWRSTFISAPNSCKINTNNGTVTTGGVFTPGDPGGLTIGSRGQNFYFANADFGEVLEFASDLSDANVSKMFGYLNANYPSY